MVVVNLQKDQTKRAQTLEGCCDYSMTSTTLTSTTTVRVFYTSEIQHYNIFPKTLLTYLTKIRVLIENDHLLL